MRIIIDWNRTLFEPSTGTLYADAIPFLLTLKEKNIPVVIVSAAETNWERDAMVPVEAIVENIIVGRKTVDLFRALGKNEIPRDVFVIGDYIYNEIALGNRCGYTTIQILRDKFQTLIPRNPDEQPQHQIHSLDEAFTLFSSSSTDS